MNKLRSTEDTNLIAENASNLQALNNKGQGPEKMELRLSAL